MILHFNYVKLYNFGSYHEAVLNLADRGFCLVSGQNNYIKDNANSNGSGKSMCWSAICFALTGETINGIHANLKNINVDENLSYVEVNLKINAKEYTITRYIAPKSDLKIVKDEIDISGKTLTDSKKILEAELPDLTHELLSSTILLGQGLPNKLSSFTPAGRKELLEKLTKSDYMIADIKTRLESRQDVLSKQDKEYSDSLLISNNTLALTQSQLIKLKIEYDNAKKPDFDSLIADLSSKISALQETLSKDTDLLTNYRESLDTKNKELLSLTETKNTEISELTESFNQSVYQQQLTKVKVDNEIVSLKHEISHLKSIKDICPTCGQRLPNILKPDTSKQEAQLKALEESSSAVAKELADKQLKKSSYLNDITSKYAIKLNNINTEIINIKTTINNLNSKIANNNSMLLSNKTKLAEVEYSKNTWDKYYLNLKTQIDTKELEVVKLQNSVSTVESARLDLNDHLVVLKKISTLVARDFRGYLLEDIIKYLDKKAKEYCQIVFGTTDLSIQLDKNNLNISYCGKSFDSLSGGEKQRCDIILQFAIRDLLQVYLGYSSNIIVLDEVFDNLDAKATEKILELISTKLKDIESVFIISHHSSELGLSYDTEIMVIKNESGISEIIKN